MTTITQAYGRGAIAREPKDGEVTEGNLGFPLFVTGEPERSEGNLGFPLFDYREVTEFHS